MQLLVIFFVSLSGLPWKWEWESFSIGNSHENSVKSYGNSQKSCGNSVGMGMEILFPRQPWF